MIRSNIRVVIPFEPSDEVPQPNGYRFDVLILFDTLSVEEVDVTSSQSDYMAVYLGGKSCRLLILETGTKSLR